MATHTTHKSTADGKARTRQLRELRTQRRDVVARDQAGFRRYLRGEER